MEQTMEISVNNPLIITNEGQLEQVISRVMLKFGFNKKDGDEQEEVSEMPTGLAKKYLINKGYNVRSGPPFNALMEEYNITAKRRGKENWYKVKDLERIPGRK